MICAVSIGILGIGPLGFCFGPGTRYRGVRALFTRQPDRWFGFNIRILRFHVVIWK